MKLYCILLDGKEVFSSNRVEVTILVKKQFQQAFPERRYEITPPACEECLCPIVEYAPGQYSCRCEEGA